MYYLKSNITRVNKFYLQNHYILMIWQPSKLINYNASLEVYSGELVNIHHEKDAILIEKDFEGNKVLLKNEEKEFNSGIDGVQILINDSKYLRTCYSDDFSSTYLALYDIEKHEDIWRIQYAEHISFYAKDEYLLHLQKNKVVKLDLLTSEVIFSIDYKEGDFTKVVAVYGNQLFVACTNHRLISIDIKTGKIIREWKELKGFDAGQEYKDLLPEPSDFVLDKESGKLIGVFSKYYFEIDLESGEINYEDVREELKRLNINSFRRMGDNPYTKDHIFVTAHAELKERANVDLDCVLALNRNTKKVDWVHIFKDTGLGTNVPQITDTHLYQLDTEGTLHIFEKET